jgi:hypothetical protein
MRGTIILEKNATCWYAKFTGPVADTVQIAFGCTIIPTAFTAAAEAADVKRAVAKDWKGCSVLIGGLA